MLSHKRPKYKKNTEIYPNGGGQAFFGFRDLGTDPGQLGRFAKRKNFFEIALFLAYRYDNGKNRNIRRRGVAAGR
jgi:hypothetical protein